MIFNENEFIKFGRILDQEQRKLLIKYWNNAKKGIFIKVPSKLKKYTKIIEQIFKNNKSASLLRLNESIENEVKSNVFNGFNEIQKNYSMHHPYLDEEADFIEWENKSTTSFFRGYKKFVSNIKEYYSDKEYNFPFFDKKYDEIKQLSADKNKKDKDKKDILLNKQALHEEMINRWDNLLNNKKDKWFIEQLDNWRKSYLEELYEQIDKFNKMKDILSPFSNELGRLWDLSKGLWKNIGFEVLEHYARLIEQERGIAELAEYLGRMQGERAQLVEKMIQTTEIVPKIKIEEAAKEEIIGIHESDDINHLLSSEVVLLSDKTTEILFYAKLAEKKLLTYDFYGYSFVDEEISGEELQEVEEGETKGPIIICVDTSGSMHGVPEKIAKVLSFAILRIALLQNRKCYLISFSTGIKTIELTDFYNNLPSLINFLSFSFHGGTDATPALYEAVKMLQTEDYKNADVLMISDFIMSGVDSDLEERINQTKNNGTEYHSLVISSSGNKQVLEIFDNNWEYNMSSPQPFAQILEKLEELRKKKKQPDEEN